MKKLLPLAGAACILLAAFSACQPDVYEGDVNGARYDQRSIKAQNAYFTVSVTGSISDLVDVKKNGVPAEFTLTTSTQLFDNGSYNGTDINADIKDGVVPGVKIYTVKAVSSVLVPDSELAYQARVLDSNKISLIVALKENVAITNRFYVEVNPKEITFNNGVKERLNTDGDRKPGEETEDLYFGYVNVATSDQTNYPVTAVTGTQKSLPKNAISISGAVYTDIQTVGGKDIVLTITDVAGNGGNINLTELKKAFKIEKLNLLAATKAWAPVDFNLAYQSGDDTKVVLSVTTASAHMDVYRSSFNSYYLVEQNAALGYIHRGSTNEAHNLAAWTAGNDTFVWQNTIGAVTGADTRLPGLNASPTVSLGDNQTPNQYQYIDFVLDSVSGGSPDAGTLQFSPALDANALGTKVKLFYLDTGTNPLRKEVTKADGLNLVQRGDTTFRLELPAKFYSYGNGSKFELHLDGVTASWKESGTAKSGTFVNQNYDPDENYYNGVYVATVTVP